ncbi:hypothetical protein FOA43_001320 [Brettanomyces nanus]|uniref:F-actin-capping protein subunit alpha n=1 Tax=Eeniella nana TaxID=13502 RepID=A0A875RZC0_EENNA|nr:uncharacterized protein FOA43_001320 [Brettanomyces nanus]QPG74003.1 hypothetical protein FOA43_001320 [Brettanomyces nanus]
MSLQSIISSMIDDAPPGSKNTLQKDFKTILNNDNSRKIIAQNLKQYHLNRDYKLVKLNDDDFGIISKFNQSGLKYYDPVLKLKFDYDFENFKVIDVEPVVQTTPSPQLDALNNQICDYALQHYPTFYKGIAVADTEDADIVYLIIVDENLNDANFYNGKWQSFYSFNVSSGELSGDISVKVHYYEDGNVALNTKTHVTAHNVTYDNVMDKISNEEDRFEITLLNKFNQLNEDQFKNLRRQLPINKTKVQWGKAIGNYNLGKDVAAERNI